MELKRLSSFCSHDFSCAKLGGDQFERAKLKSDHRDEVARREALVKECNTLRLATTLGLIPVVLMTIKANTTGFTFDWLSLRYALLLGGLAMIYVVVYIKWGLSEQTVRESDKRLAIMAANNDNSFVELHALADPFLAACNVVYTGDRVAWRAANVWNIYAMRVNNGTVHRFSNDEFLAEKIEKLHDAARSMDEKIAQLYRDHIGWEEDRAKGITTGRPNSATLSVALEQLQGTPEYRILASAEGWYKINFTDRLVFAPA